MEDDVHIKFLSSKLGICYYIIQSLKGVKVQIPSRVRLLQTSFISEVRHAFFWGGGRWWGK